MAISTDGYTLLKTITLPGTAGGHGDYVVYDSDTNTTWLAQSPDNNVVVIDDATNTIKATIPNIGNANGVAFSSQYAYVADVTNDTTDVIDKRTFQVVAKVAQTGTTPDGIVYIPTTNQIAVASDDNDVLDFINATGAFAQTASLQLTPNPSVNGPDVPLYVPQKDLIYQPNDGQVDVIDPHTQAIVGTWNLLSTGAVKPLAYDPVTNHFFVGTTNNEALVVDGNSGAVVNTIALSGSVDEVSTDVSARLAFFGDKAGSADIVDLDSNQLVGQLPAEKNFHTLSVDPNTHDAYVYENNRNTVDVYGPANQLNSVYRFYDAATNDHFFTANITEANTVLTTLPAYRFEGVIAATAAKGPDTTDVYRFFDTATNSHFYTASTAERDQVLSSLPTFRYEGVAFEAYANPATAGSASVTMERFYNTQTHVHTYSGDATEIAAINGGKEGAGWVDEGQAFTVHAATASLLHT